MLRSPPVYTTGTISGLQGQTGVTGSSTGWIVTDSTGAQTSNIAQYDELIVGSNRPILIQAVVDDQHLTLQEPLPFNIPTGSAYTILKNTVSPTTSVMGILQQILALGTDTSPYGYRTFDNGVSRLRVDFDDQGRIRFEVGATGADGSSGHLFHTAILIDPATGNVSATGLTSSGGQTSTFNTIWSVVGALPDSLGVDGDYNFDLINGLVTGPKTAGTWVGARAFDLKAAVKAAAASATAAATSASAAAASAAAAASVLSSGLADGQCILKYVSATQIALFPQDGGSIVINGVQCQVPSVGVSSANFGSTNAQAFVYVFMDGATMRLVPSTTPPSVDSAGRKVMSGDPTRRLVGQYLLDGSGQFQDQSSARGVLSYFNRRAKFMSWNFDSTTTSTSRTSLTGTHAVLAWADELVEIYGYAEAILTTNISPPYAALTLQVDGGQLGGAANGTANIFAQYTGTFLASKGAAIVGDGSHTIETFGLTSAGTVRFVGTMTATVRG